MKSKSGQAALEMLFIFPVGIILFTLIIWCTACAWSLFWGEFQLQEAVICLSDQTRQECELRYQQRIHSGAHFLKITQFQLEKRKDLLYGKLSFTYPFSGKQSFNMEKKIPWPLRQY